jgi:hypothetical protein
MKIKNANDARIALEQLVSDLLSGKATNLDAANLGIKGFSVLVSQQRNHQKECVLNGKTSVKQNAGWAKYAKEASTADQEAKAKAKAEAEAEALAKADRQAAARKRKLARERSQKLQTKAKAKRGPGRPKGSKNKAKA